MPANIDIHQIGVIAMCVILTLLAMSVLSVAIIVERLWVYRRVASQSRQCALEAARLLRIGNLREAQELSRKTALRDSHVARLLHAGLREWEQEDIVDDETRLETARTAIRHAASETLGDMRRGLGALGTIASTAPFVGLFGTTFGIINAFAAMSQTGSTTMTSISAGISEALITTAFGLFVAIPAVWAYNALGGRVERFAGEMERSGDQLVLFLARRIR
jgi:biopolymer transport protein ExbB/TolQ